MTIRNEATQDADRVLATLWTPIKIPVDPVKIARRLGIDVINTRLDPNVAAALVKEPGQDPVIFLNLRDAPNRKRFSCAHEIGHFVRRSERPEAYEYIDFRDTVASAGNDPEEIYANSFAAELLMPEREIKRRKGKSEIELAVAFDVSQEAMNYRLANLGLKT